MNQQQHNNITSLLPAPILYKDKCREGFYVEEKNGLFWLGYLHPKGHHQLPISKEFYNAFLKEKNLLKSKLP